MAYFRIGAHEITPDKFFDNMATDAFVKGEPVIVEEIFKELSYRFSGRGDIAVIGWEDQEDDTLAQ